MPNWNDVEAVPCDPQSLTGYAAEAHKRTGGTCIYCGFGIGRIGDAVLQFDVLRQLALEHIVPRALADGDVLRKGIDTGFPNLPAGMGAILAERVKAMNEWTVCPSCNFFAASRLAEETITDFEHHLTDPHPEVVSLNTKEAANWLRELGPIILKAWDEKSKLVRAKILYLWKHIGDRKLDVALNVALPERRTSPPLAFVDRRFGYLLGQEAGKPFDL